MVAMLKRYQRGLLVVAVGFAAGAWFGVSAQQIRGSDLAKKHYSRWARYSPPADIGELTISFESIGNGPDADYWGNYWVRLTDAGALWWHSGQGADAVASRTMVDAEGHRYVLQQGPRPANPGGLGGYFMGVGSNDYQLSHEVPSMLLANRLSFLLGAPCVVRGESGDASDVRRDPVRWAGIADLHRANFRSGGWCLPPRWQTRELKLALLLVA